MIVYTFRTFPYKEHIKEYVDDVFVFSKLKQDLAVLESQLDQEQPKYLIGVATTKGASRVEPYAINKFNKGTVLKDSDAILDLFIPQDISFPIAPKPTHTFCNWTMYNIQKIIRNKGYDTKLVFIHLNPKDLPELVSFINATSA